MFLFGYIIHVKGGRVEPIIMATDNSILNDGDFNVSVTLPSDLVEWFVQKLQKINHLTLKDRLVYV